MWFCAAGPARSGGAVVALAMMVLLVLMLVGGKEVGNWKASFVKGGRGEGEKQLFGYMVACVRRDMMLVLVSCC